jgi:hypothetical protein
VVGDGDRLYNIQSKAAVVAPIEELRYRSRVGRPGIAIAEWSRQKHSMKRRLARAPWAAIGVGRTSSVKRDIVRGWPYPFVNHSSLAI